MLTTIPVNSLFHNFIAKAIAAVLLYDVSHILNTCNKKLQYKHFYRNNVEICKIQWKL